MLIAIDEHDPAGIVEGAAQAAGGGQAASAAAENDHRAISHDLPSPQNVTTLSAHAVQSASWSRVERWAPLVRRSSSMPRASVHVPQ
jgi:hypothetical protein